MAWLEYRLLKEDEGFPVLYQYERISRDEIALRFACDYFVKERIIYEKTSCAAEADRYVIYVKEAEEEQIVDSTPRSLYMRGILLEVREYKEEGMHYPVVRTHTCRDHEDALLYIMSDYVYIEGREWERTSAEIDEDRGVCVYYARPVS